jgi:hypothetical protein
MDSKTLYKDKAVYQKLEKIIKKYDLPQLSDIAYQINKMIEHCKLYEKWGINYWEWGYSINKFCNASFIKRSPYSNEYKKNQALGTDREYFLIYFPTGAYIFGDEYYSDLFCEFFDKLVEITQPFYVDELNHELYYTEENAGKANDAVEPLYKEYKEKYQLLKKERKIKELKAQLAEMENDNEKL